MTTYNEAGLTYDEVGFLYNGIELGPEATLIVNELDVTAKLAAGSLSAHVATQGNSLGTLDARLIDPASMPVVDQAIDLYAGVDRLFRGTAKVVTTDEYRGGHLFVGISAQDAGPSGGLPTAAPFGLSDNPNGSTTRGYESLQVVTRTTEGGAAKSTARATYRANGLWAGMNVELTSANNGLTAEELTIVDATVSWPIKAAPKYVLTLGDPLVKLAQVLAHQALEDGVITSTMISDGAISTPKLAANAVIANVANVGDTVVIDDTGIEITGGAVTVRNSGGTVIIDGEHDMFRILATGTLTTSSFTGPGQQTASTDLALGLAYMPVYLYLVEFNAVVGGYSGFMALWSTTTAHVQRSYELVGEMVGTDLRLTARTNNAVADVEPARTYRYYVLEQVAF